MITASQARADNEPTVFICYQCDKECHYLFDDSRCGDCTRLTPEQVRGEEPSHNEDD